MNASTSGNESIVLHVGGVALEASPTGDDRQWFLTIDQVAEGYGVARNTIFTHLKEHADEIRDGIEKGVGITDTPGGTQKKTVLYREGVIKLGFFVRSERAKQFRQAATDLIVQLLDARHELTISADALLKIKIDLCLVPKPIDYERTFPVELFSQFARLSGYDYVPGRHQVAWSKIIDDIYKSLGEDVYAELKRRNAAREVYHHQHGTPAYREAIQRRCDDVILIAKVSRDMADFRSKFNAAFKGRGLQLSFFDMARAPQVRASSVRQLANRRKAKSARRARRGQEVTP